MEKKINRWRSLFSGSGKKALLQQYPANAPFLSNPDTRGVTSSQLQRISSSSDKVPMASGHTIKTAAEENAKLDLDGLITYISKLFEIKEGKISSYEPKKAQQYWPTSQSFINLKKLLYDGVNYSNSNPVYAKAIVSNILQGMGSANNIVAAGFLVIANILERIDDVRANRMECLSLLKEMTKLAKVVKDFKERTHLREKMNNEIRDATTLIVEGSLMCCTQIDSSKFSKFFNTSVNKDELIKIRKELDTVYRDLQHKMGFFTFENTEKISEKINGLWTQKEAPDQRRAYTDHPTGHVPPPPPLGPIIIYAQTVNLQTGALPSSTGCPERPSQLPYISKYPAPEQLPRTKSPIMATSQQQQAQDVQQREPGSAARRNEPEKNDQIRRSTRTQTLVSVQTKEQPLSKAEEDKRREQERLTKEADERKVRDAVEKTKGKNEKSKTEDEEVKRSREAETRKPLSAVQLQKSQNPEESQRKRDPGVKREPPT